MKRRLFIKALSGIVLATIIPIASLVGTQKPSAQKPTNKAKIMTVGDHCGVDNMNPKKIRYEETIKGKTRCFITYSNYEVPILYFASDKWSAHYLYPQKPKNNTQHE